MTRFPRNVVALVLIVGVVLTAQAGSESLERMGFDFWNVPELNAQMRAYDEKRQDLVREADDIRRLREVNHAVIGEWIAGRRSLSEALVELEQINQDRPAFFQGLMVYGPVGTTHRGLLAWYAFLTARATLECDATRNAEIILRLEAEYRALYPLHLGVPTVRDNSVRPCLDPIWCEKLSG